LLNSEIIKGSDETENKLSLTTRIINQPLSFYPNGNIDTLILDKDLIEKLGGMEKLLNTDEEKEAGIFSVLNYGKGISFKDVV